MKAAFLIALNLFSSILFSACAASRESQPKFSVLQDFNPLSFTRMAVFVADKSRSIYHEGILVQVENEFIQTAIDKGYQLVSRSDKDEILEELQFQKSKYADTADLAYFSEIGHMLRVPGILIVTINSVTTNNYRPLIRMEGQQYYVTTVSISARFINAESAQILWIASCQGDYKGNHRNQEGEAIVEISKVVAEGIPILRVSEKKEGAKTPEVANPVPGSQ